VKKATSGFHDVFYGSFGDVLKSRLIVEIFTKQIILKR